MHVTPSAVQLLSVAKQITKVRVKSWVRGYITRLPTMCGAGFKALTFFLGLLLQKAKSLAFPCRRPVEMSCCVTSFRRFFIGVLARPC